MTSPAILFHRPVVRALAVAGIAILAYLLIWRLFVDGTWHWSVAIVIGVTLGIHTYRRSRA